MHFWYILIPIAQKGKKFVTFAIRVRTMWYEEKVSNFEIAVAKLKKSIGKHQICHTLLEHSVGKSLWRPKIFIMIKIRFPYGNFTLTLP